MLDLENKPIDWTKPIPLNTGLKLIERYFKIKHLIDVDTSTNTRLSELLKDFYDKETVKPNIFGLLRHIDSLYKKEGDNLLKQCAPFHLGIAGDTSLNEIIDKAKNFKDFNIKNFEIAEGIYINPLAVISDGVVYTMITKGFDRYVFNVKIPNNIPLSMQKDIFEKNRKLRAIFYGIVAPLIVLEWSIRRKSLIGPLLIINENLGTDFLNKDKNSSSLLFFGLIKHLNNKIVKVILFIISLFFLLYIFLNTNSLMYVTYLFSFLTLYKVYIYIFVIIICSLLVLYLILSLYLLHNFIKSQVKGFKVQISSVLPNFLIKYLQNLENYSKSEETIGCIKSLYYRYIIIFLLVLTVYLALVFL